MYATITSIVAVPWGLFLTIALAAKIKSAGHLIEPTGLELSRPT